jgi:lactoylglutathione lyase
MGFCWSTLRVRNLEESIKFYEDIAGLKVTSRFPAGPGSEIAFLGDGDTKIELISGGSADIDAGNDISWGFTVASVDAALALMKEKGIAVEGGPTQPNPHLRFFFIRDPNGMKIQLVENIA